MDNKAQGRIFTEAEFALKENHDNAFRSELYQGLAEIELRISVLNNITLEEVAAKLQKLGIKALEQTK